MNTRGFVLDHRIGIAQAEGFFFHPKQPILKGRTKPTLVTHAQEYSQIIHVWGLSTMQLWSH